MHQAVMLTIAILFPGVFGLRQACSTTECSTRLRHSRTPRCRRSSRRKWDYRCVMNGNGKAGRTMSRGRDRSGTFIDFNQGSLRDANFEKYERYRNLKFLDCGKI